MSSHDFLNINGRLYCYTGTLGALVEGGGSKYILSNNHVLAKENGELNNPGGRDDGDIIQPGLLDQGTCSLDSGSDAEAVATLSDHVVIQFSKRKNKPLNYVDAAIAEVATETSDAILGIGTINGHTGDAMDMPVQKTGRTTGHTFGTIKAVDVTVDVSYESGTARFSNQMRIRRPCDDAGFSAGGDSGSLITTVPDSGDPQAVGLLFAGGSTDTFANPIGPVLDAFSLSIPAWTGDGDTAGAMLADHAAIADNCPVVDSGGGRRGGRRFGAGGPAGLDVARAVKARHSGEIFTLPDVVGHGVGADENGAAVIEIYVSSKARRAVGRAFPAEFEGVSVRVVETGKVLAY